MEFSYVYQNQFKTGEYVPAHSHNCHELIFYPLGKGTVSVGNTVPHRKKSIQFETDSDRTASELKALPYDEASLIILPPSVVHDEFHSEYGSSVSIGFRLTTAESHRFGRIFGSVYNASDEILSFVQEIQSEFQNQRPFFDMIIVSDLLRILTDLSRRQALCVDSFDLNYFLSFLDENYMLKINICELAEKAGYSSSQFRNLFKKHTGLSPKNYVMQKRINAAKRLLADSELQVAEVAQMCGYDNIFDFSAIFKKHMGVSPSDYCKQIKK